MSKHTKHQEDTHQHGFACGHVAIIHAGHTDYLHDGHLQYAHLDHVDEHVLEINAMNPERCTSSHECAGHDKAHVHGPGCAHERVPHGSHLDYLVDGHLHHPHGNHCDDHGPVSVRRKP
ncbi:MAG: Uncharacterized protein JWO04_51 [Gammaproteobacteria bacterium]|nr:Uncharacterized protein [Gammaproteobacteria bacterium]